MLESSEYTGCNNPYVGINRIRSEGYKSQPYGTPLSLRQN